MSTRQSQRHMYETVTVCYMYETFTVGYMSGMSLDLLSECVVLFDNFCFPIKDWLGADWASSQELLCFVPCFVTSRCLPLFVSSSLFPFAAGCGSPVDVSSMSHNGQLLLFSAGTLCYGLQSDIAMFSHDFTWLGDRRVDLAQFRALLTFRYLF